MESIALSGTSRKDVGTKSAKELRRSERVPCVLYGGKENTHFDVRELDVRNIVFTGEFRTVDIDIEGSKHKAILKDVQFHPVTDRIQHIDFQELVDGRKIVCEIPIRLTGFATGVQAGGKLEQTLRSITIKALPKDLVDHLEVDVTALELGKSIKIREIDTKGLEIMNSDSVPVASVVVPRALRSAQSEQVDDAGADVAEGEAGEGEASGEE